MATQPIETTASPVPGNGADDGGPRDYQAEARGQGWIPLEHFKGDPANFVDAEEFVLRADKRMPLLTKRNIILERELKDLRKSALRMEEHFTKAEQRIRDELTAKMEVAVERGDVAGFRKLKGESDALGDAPQAGGTDDALEVFEDFCTKNTWYERGNLASATDDQVEARLYTDRRLRTMSRAAQSAGLSGKALKAQVEADFATIEDEVAEKFPGLNARTPRAKPASDVAGVTRGGTRSSAARTFTDLPPEAQRACDKWVKQGLIKDRAAYVASYNFEGKN